MKKIISSIGVFLILFLLTPPSYAWWWGNYSSAALRTARYNSGQINFNRSLITTNADNIATNKVDIENLQNQISEPATSEPTGVMSNGTLIGIVEYTLNTPYIELTFNENFESIHIGAEGKIQFKGNPGSGDFFTLQSTFYFKTPDCTGSPYVMYLGGNTESGLPTITPFNFKPIKGKVFDYQGILYFYPPLEENVYQFSPQSLINNGNCVSIGSGASPQKFLKLLPNDSGITGIETYPFPTPIKVGELETVFVIEE